MKVFLLVNVIFLTGCLPEWWIEWRGEVNKTRLRLQGEATLLREESEKRVAIEEAKALLESATFKAQAEVERAKGVAEANKIIGESLKGNESYLRYLWIQGLQDGSSETIYIPTEANLPILEANRRKNLVK